MLPRTSTPAASLPPLFSQQLPHSRQLVHPTPHGHSVTHSSSLSGSVHEMSVQSSLGQEASSSQELFTSQVPHMGASNAVYNGLNATGVHSLSQPLLNPCHIVEPSQPGHAFHQPTLYFILKHSSLSPPHQTRRCHQQLKEVMLQLHLTSSLLTFPEN